MEAQASADPTAEATSQLMNKNRGAIMDCNYKDFGVGMKRTANDENSLVSLVLGAPPEPKPEPAPQPAPKVDPVAVPVPPKPAAPTDAVRTSVSQNPLNVRITVTNTSALAGDCDYDAAPTNNRLLPPVHRDFTLSPNGSHELSLAAPPVGVTYGYTVVCRGDFEGQNVEFGRATGQVTGSL